MIDIDKKKLFLAFAEDFAAVVNEFRKARREADIGNVVFCRDDEEALDERNKRLNSLKESKDYINLTRVEYWENIMKSKIEVIGALGGLQLMSDFLDFLYDHSPELKKIEDKYENIQLGSAFDWYADGIHGWLH